MPLDYALLIVAGVYLALGVGFVHWQYWHLHRHDKDADQ